jgi:ribosomal protein S18 acetylase RimI-like enzyme
MSSNLRLATSTDLPAVENVVRRAYAHYVDRIGQKPSPMSDDYGALINSGHVYVVEEDGRIQAIIVLIAEDHALLLDNVAVLPSAQGMGLGRMLLEFAEQSARRCGFRFIKLYTNEAMTENLNLYRRIGYRETHRAEEKGLKRVYMLKELT